MNKKNDSIAKKAYVEELKKKGFSNIRITSAPADICAEKDGYTYYFEIKMTRQPKKYFGAATLTEWEQAIKDPEHYRFVVALQSEDDLITRFIEFEPDEFMKYSSIPPFKIFFNLDLQAQDNSRKDDSIRVTKDKIEQMVDFYKKIIHK
ncbi:MAG: DUF3883 domain-containing protein [Clostridia bacterium]|nr:DUF3883 domain-containing protein [Clostridia bacterium]